ncbi:hypothetical protein D3C83_209250 [compost metagenome]
MDRVVDASIAGLDPLGNDGADVRRRTDCSLLYLSDPAISHRRILELSGLSDFDRRHRQLRFLQRADRRAGRAFA